MEQERYNWMWNKRKEGFNSHILLSKSPSYGDSWEEQAFAEDAAGPHGGCIWPPRSYTCSFCRREFRSAQALGGHMNVHRRDRARLKQNPNPNINLDNNHNQILNPSQNICLSMVSNPNNSDHLDHAFHGSPSSISSSRVSILPIPNINDKRTFLPPFSSSPFIQESLKSISTTPISSCSNLDPKKCFQIQGLEKEKSSKVFESNSCITKKNQATNDLSMNLNLVIRQSCEMAFDDKDDDDDDLVVLGYKRRRIEETISFFPKRVLVDRDHQPDSEVLDEQSSSSTENLDLELRLGDRPK